MTKGASDRSIAVRAGWLVGGLVCVGVGGVGIVVPGLPTTVFFIMAAACFSKSSTRLEAWVLGLPRIGPIVRDHRNGLGMPRRAKQVACACIVGFGLLAVVLVPSLPARVAIAVAVAAGVAYVGWRVPTREVVLASRSRARAAGQRAPRPP